MFERHQIDHNIEWEWLCVDAGSLMNKDKNIEKRDQFEERKTLERSLYHKRDPTAQCSNALHQMQ